MSTQGFQYQVDIHSLNVILLLVYLFVRTADYGSTLLIDSTPEIAPENQEITILLFIGVK